LEKDAVAATTYSYIVAVASTFVISGGDVRHSGARLYNTGEFIQFSSFFRLLKQLSLCQKAREHFAERRSRVVWDEVVNRIRGAARGDFLQHPSHVLRVSVRFTLNARLTERGFAEESHRLPHPVLFDRSDRVRAEADAYFGTA
jgi:hypothetical protein